jgi:hypothetical protein
MNRDSYTNARIVALARQVADIMSGESDEARELAQWIIQTQSPNAAPQVTGGELPAKAKARDQAPADAAEWCYRYDGRLYSRDFEHDATLHLTGDFKDEAQKTAYAQKLCALLNAAPREAEAGAVQETTGAPAVPATDGPGGENIATVLRGFDEGVFVRDISRDHEPGWAVKLLPFLAALVRLSRTTATYGSDK